MTQEVKVMVHNVKKPEILKEVPSSYCHNEIFLVLELDEYCYYSVRHCSALAQNYLPWRFCQNGSFFETMSYSLY